MKNYNFFLLCSDFYSPILSERTFCNSSKSVFASLVEWFSISRKLFPFSGAFMKVMNNCSKASCGALFIIAFHSYFSFLLFISNYLLIMLFPVSLRTNGLLVHDVKLLLNSCFHDSPSSFWQANPCQLCSLSPDKSSRTTCEHWVPCVK